MRILDNRPGFRVVQGDMMKDPAQILVCPVNCQPGAMGAGLALAFHRRFPKIKEIHDSRCREGGPCGLRINWPVLIHDVERDDETGCRLRPRPDIILFPTKEHPQNDSRAEWIWGGLARLYKILGNARADGEEVSIAMPALGCGLGRLGWEIVGPMISIWQVGLPERFNVTLYAPHGR